MNRKVWWTTVCIVWIWVQCVTSLALAQNNPVIDLNTSRGPLRIELFANRSPQNVGHFLSLIRGAYYKAGFDVEVHKNFRVILSRKGDQGKDALSYRIKDELAAGEEFQKAGVLAMMPNAPDDNGSKFMITLNPTPHLKHSHTVIGRVTKGLDQLKDLQAMPRTANGVFQVSDFRQISQHKSLNLTFFKIYPWTRKQVEALAIPMVRKFADTIANMEGWGTAQKAEFKDYSQRGSQFQFTVDLTYVGFTPARVLMLAHRDRDKLIWKHTQIRRPKPVSGQVSQK